MVTFIRNVFFILLGTIIFGILGFSLSFVISAAKWYFFGPSKNKDKSDE